MHNSKTRGAQYAVRLNSRRFRKEEEKKEKKKRKTRPESNPAVVVSVTLKMP
jgi:hypothetical protein